MLGTVRHVCTRPTEAFSRMGPAPALSPPVAIVFAHAVLALFLVLVPALARYPGLVSSSEPITMTTSAGTVELPRLWFDYMVTGIVGPFLDWLNLSLVLFVATKAVVLLASRFDEGSLASRSSEQAPPTRATLPGQLRRTVVFVGWGLLPQILGVLLPGLIVVGFAGLGVEVADGKVLGTPAMHMVGHADAYPLIEHLTHGVGALVTLWTGYIWVGALRAGCDVDRRTAMVVVVPFTLALVYVSDFMHAHPEL